MTLSHDLIAAVIGFFPLRSSFNAWKQGKNRQFGIQVENQAIEKLRQSLPTDWEIERNLSAGSIGDIDLVVTLPDRKRYVVEIKSWGGLRQNWTGWLVKMSGAGLHKNVVRQVWQQCNAVGSRRPVIWMPLAKNQTYFNHRKGIMVVNGDHTTLLEALKWLDRNTKQHYFIRFPAAPEKSMCWALKYVGMRYDGTHWEGYLTRVGIEALLPSIYQNNGKVESLDLEGAKPPNDS